MNVEQRRIGSMLVEIVTCEHPAPGRRHYMWAVNGTVLYRFAAPLMDQFIFKLYREAKQYELLLGDGHRMAWFTDWWLNADFAAFCFANIKQLQEAVEG